MPGLDVPGNDPGAALDAGDVREHLRRLRRDRHRARAGLGISEIQFARLQFYVLPAQRQDLVQPAAGEQQQPDRGNGVDRNAHAGLRLGERAPEAAELLLGEEPFAPAFPVLHHRPARVARLRQLPPVLRRVPDAREDVDRLVRHRRRRPQGVMDFRHPRMVERQRRASSRTRAAGAASRSPCTCVPCSPCTAPRHARRATAGRGRPPSGPGRAPATAAPAPSRHQAGDGASPWSVPAASAVGRKKPVIEIPPGKSGSVARAESANLRAGNCAEVRDPSAYGLFGPPTRRPFRVSWRWLSPWKRAICLGGVRQCVSVAAH